MNRLGLAAVAMLVAACGAAPPATPAPDAAFRAGLDQLRLDVAAFSEMVEHRRSGPAVDALALQIEHDAGLLVATPASSAYASCRAGIDVAATGRADFVAVRTLSLTLARCP